MKKHPILIVALIFMLAGLPAAGQAYELSLEITDGNDQKSDFHTGETLYVNINFQREQADDDAGKPFLAGCAFTLTYPKDALVPPTTDSDGLSNQITSIFPFTFIHPDTSEETQTHRENVDDAASPGKILFAAAEIDESNGGGKELPNGTLFSVQFTVKEGAAFGAYGFQLIQTQLLNEDAGWGNNGEPEPVPVLVGAVDKTDPAWAGEDLSDDFPILLNSLDPAPEAGFDVVGYSVSGDISYSPADQGGTIYIEVGYSENFDGNAVASTSISAPGPYTITNVPEGSGYYVRAFRDSDGGGAADVDPGEAIGHTDASFNVAGTVTGKNVSLSDPLVDCDPPCDPPVKRFEYDEWADSFLPGHDIGEPNEDYDRDGKTNVQEFIDGTDATDRCDPECKGALPAVLMLLLGNGNGGGDNNP